MTPDRDSDKARSWTKHGQENQSVGTRFPALRHHPSSPKWWVPLNVGITSVLAFLAIVIFALAQGNVGKQADDAKLPCLSDLDPWHDWPDVYGGKRIS